jgi:hypothetical protein
MAAATGGAFAIRQVRHDHAMAAAGHFTPAGQTRSVGASSDGAIGGTLSWPCDANLSARPATVVPSPAPRDHTHDVDGHPLAALPGWRWYQVNGLATTVPVGWSAVTRGSITCFYEPSSPGILGFVTLVPTKDTAVDELKAQAARFVAAHGRPGYRNQLIQSISFQSNDAEWDFSYTETVDSQAVPMEAMVYLVRVNANVAYAYFWTSKQLDWSSRLNFTGTLEASLLMASD